MSSSDVLSRVGDTPLVTIRPRAVPGATIHAKLEGHNPTGSVKDRAAAQVLAKLIAERPRDYRDVLLVESSSGNFGVALAAQCRAHEVPFCCVIDPRISRTNEILIHALGASVIKVGDPDEAGGFLRTRLRAVERILDANARAQWVNQYASPLVADAYIELGHEIADALAGIDFVFLAVSSGGTIAGVSRAIKHRFPACRVVAVDIAGSVIFGGPPGPRHIPGIGSSIVPHLLERALIDEVVVVDEDASIRACHELLAHHGVFVGGSSGSVFAAIQQRLGGTQARDVAVACVFPDRGDRYVDTIYDAAWVSSLLTMGDAHALRR